MKSVPVYRIKDFHTFSEENAFYANYLKPHIWDHDFTNHPHKHDFYFLVLFTSGSGTHEVDFRKYPVSAGSLFLLRPGQMHNWKVSADCEGYLFFHTRDFYEERFASALLSDYAFYSSYHVSPLLQLKNKSLLHVETLLKEITEEYDDEKKLKAEKLHALVNLVYVEVARHYPSPIRSEKENYLHKLKQFEELVDLHFREFKNAGKYAAFMNISEKHLNRIIQLNLKKTSTDLISERITLEAKRLLLQGKFNVNEIAFDLGFKDPSYFTRFFKKHTQETPSYFVKRYK